MIRVAGAMPHGEPGRAGSNAARKKEHGEIDPGKWTYFSW